jgi:hypothetical protein
MRIKPVIVSLCAAALAISSASATETQSNSVSSKEKQVEQQKKICKWLPVTGSNRQEKHCLTKEDWKKAEALSW